MWVNGITEQRLLKNAVTTVVAKWLVASVSTLLLWYWPLREFSSLTAHSTISFLYLFNVHSTNMPSDKKERILCIQSIQSRWHHQRHRQLFAEYSIYLFIYTNRAFIRFCAWQKQRRSEKKWEKATTAKPLGGQSSECANVAVESVVVVNQPHMLGRLCVTLEIMKFRTNCFLFLRQNGMRNSFPRKKVWLGIHRCNKIRKKKQIKDIVSTTTTSEVVHPLSRWQLFHQICNVRMRAPAALSIAVLNEHYNSDSVSNLIPIDEKLLCVDWNSVVTPQWNYKNHLLQWYGPFSQRPKNQKKNCHSLFSVMAAIKTMPSTTDGPWCTIQA